MPLFEFAKVKTWLVEAGAIALSYYQTQLLAAQKEDYSPVTAADREVEKFLIDRIRQAYPGTDYGIIAEESGGNWQGKELVWAIDPIDGTRVFINGVPLWCISIGLLKNGQPFRGAVYLPVTNDLYYTNDDGVALWNARPLQGQLPASWHRDSFMCVSSGAHRHHRIDFRRLRALGAIATHHVYVASGVAVAALHRQASLWDLAAAHAILTAVGGTAVYLDGAPLRLDELLAHSAGKSRGPILAGHPAVIEQLLPRISEANSAEN